MNRKIIKSREYFYGVDKELSSKYSAHNFLYQHAIKEQLFEKARVEGYTKMLNHYVEDTGYSVKQVIEVE